MTTDAQRDWKEHAQTFEADWWDSAYKRGIGLKDVDVKNVPAIRKGLHGVSRQIWQNFTFTQKTFTGKTVLDIGPGPTGRCSWLKGTFLAIEPLAVRFQQLPWHMLAKYKRVYAQPAEELIPELVGSVDAVLSLNTLDHCYDLPAILSNVYQYLKPDGLAFLSFDVDKGIYDPTHPINLTPAAATRTIKDSGLAVEAWSFGHCYPGDPWRDNWGGGTAYHWWCRKPGAKC